MNHLNTFFLDMTQLEAADAQRDAGTLKPVPYADVRGNCLAGALYALARHHGVVLQTPLHIDSRGEFKLVALPGEGKDPRLGCGHFGTFATVLNPYRPRCGVGAGATLLPECGWCYLNHFEVEKLVRAQRDAMAAQAWNLTEALEQVRAALPDTSFAAQNGVDPELIRRLSAIIKARLTGDGYSDHFAVEALQEAMRALPGAWKEHGGVPQELLERLQITEAVFLSAC